MPWLENVHACNYEAVRTSQALSQQFQKDWTKMMADWEVFTFGESSDGQYSFSINIPRDGKEVGYWKISPRCPPLQVNIACS